MASGHPKKSCNGCNGEDWVTRVTRGVGLQPENLADWLLENIDLETSQNLKACQERNKISVWKGKGYIAVPVYEGSLAEA
eukprot:1140030-Pelagomonas_calceolata.AAC.1